MSRTELRPRPGTTTAIRQGALEEERQKQGDLWAGDRIGALTLDAYDSLSPLAGRG